MNKHFCDRCKDEINKYRIWDNSIRISKKGLGNSYSIDACDKCYKLYDTLIEGFLRY